MTSLGALKAILSQLLVPQVAIFIASALTLTVFAWAWKRHTRNPLQKRIVRSALLLWLVVPASALLGSLFYFAGPDAARGVEYNQFSALAVGALLPLCALTGLVLIALGRGVRPNVAAVLISVVFVQFWVGLLSGCAIVGVCL